MNLGWQTLKCSQGDLARLANTSQPQSPVEDKYSEDIGEQKIDACNKITCSCRDMRIKNIPGEGLAAGDKVFGRLG